MPIIRNRLCWPADISRKGLSMISRLIAATLIAATAVPAAALADADISGLALSDRQRQEFVRREGRGDFAGALEILREAPGAPEAIASCRKDLGSHPLPLLRCTALALSLQARGIEFEAALRASRK
jgi:hypothetical protein